MLKKTVALILIFLLANSCNFFSRSDEDETTQETFYKFLESTDDTLSEKCLSKLKGNSYETIKSMIVSKEIKNYSLMKNEKSMTGAVYGAYFYAAGTVYNFSLLVPEDYEDYNVNKEYGLIIHLHGAGRTGDNYIKHWQEAFSQSKNNNYIVVCPTIISGSWQSQIGEEVVIELVKEIKRSYNIDDDKVFITGISMGGHGTYLMTIFHPDMFAGASPIAGAINFDKDAHLLENCSSVPFYIIHGSQDELIPVSYSQKISEKLKSLGFDVTYIEHNLVRESGPVRTGHLYPNELLPELIKWLDTKKRKPLTSKFSVHITKKYHSRIYWITPITLLTNNAHITAEISDNTMNIITKNLKKIKVHLDDQLVDFSKPVVIKINAKEVFNKRIYPDVQTLLLNYKRYRDTNFLFCAELEFVIE